MKIDKNALEDARKQFCLDIGMNWEEYLADPKQKVYIKKASYKKGTCLVDMDGATAIHIRCADGCFLLNKPHISYAFSFPSTLFVC